MNTHATLEKLIKELIGAKREYYRLAFDKEPSFRLGQPASTRQLAQLESRLGKPLPPSYAAFLELHNGWEKFDGLTNILAVEDYDKDWVKSRVKTLSSLLTEYGDDNPFAAGA